MRKFVIKTVYFILPLIIAAILMELFLRAIPNDYLFKKQYLDKHASQLEVIILGSSHSFYGLNPEYFSYNTFNASHISQSLEYDYAILKKYENQFKNLNTIILPISYFTLFKKLEADFEPWRIKNYMIYYNLNSSSSLKDYSEVLSNRINVNIKRLVSYYFFDYSAITCSKLGWGISCHSKNAQDLVETGQISAKRHTMDNINSFKCQEIFKENVLILNSIMEWCNENKIQLILLTPPAFETYRRNINSKQLDITVNAISNLCLEHRNCKYVNLFSDTNFVAADFYDADHLSEIGAKKISKLINEKINK